MKKFRYLLMLCVAGVVGFSAHAMPIGLRFAMMGRAAAAFNDPVKNIGLAQVEIDCPDVAYCGTAYEPAVQSVKWGDDTLVAGTDYTLAYSGNVDAGTATITLTGTNLFNGTYTTNFTIRPKPLTGGMVESIGNHSYTGKAQTPKPTVMDVERGMTLREGVEYTLSYANNTSIGEGFVTVTGKGNYTGSITRAFVIEPSEGSELEERLGGAGKVESYGKGGWIVTLTNDVDNAILPLEIPDNIGNVTIDLNGHDLVGEDGRDGARPSQDAGEDGKPAIVIVPGEGDGEPTVITIVNSGEDAIVQGGEGGAGNPAGNGAPAIEVADGAQDGVLINIVEGVTVQGGDDYTPAIIGEVGTNEGTIVVPSRIHIPGEGTVVVPKTWKVGQKVTWKATADKGSVFARWEGPLVDSLNLTRNERRNPSLAFAVPEGFETNMVTAVFIPLDDDGLYTLGITQTEFEFKEAVSDVCVTDDSQSYVTATASGLPAGLKFDAKKMCITGAPTKGGVYWVQIKAKNASGYQWAENVKVTVSGDGKEAKEPKLTRTAYHPLTVICATEGGTVSGTGVYAEGKKVTIKATAAKGHVFAGWCETAAEANGGGRGATALPVVSSKPAYLSLAASMNVVVPEMRYVFAKFVTAEEDRNSIELAVNGVEMAAGAGRPPYQTNIWAGVYVEWPVAAGALSKTKVKVAGLPSGLKFTDKPVTSKIGSGKTAVTVTNVPAYTIYGAPTAASKTKTDRRTGEVTVTPSAVKITVTTAGKSSQTYQIDTFVDALPAWAVGTFNGVRGDGRDGARPSQGDADAQERVPPEGLVTLTVAANGKISGKVIDADGTWTLSAASFDSYDAESETYVATVIGKNGKMAITNEMEVSAEEMAGTRDACPYRGVVNAQAARSTGSTDGSSTGGSPSSTGGSPVLEEWTAWQNLWKTEPLKTDAKPFAKAPALAIDAGTRDACPYPGTITLKFAASGAVTASGKFVTGQDSKGKDIVYSASCSSVLVPDADAAGAGRPPYRIFLYFPPKAGKFEGYGDEIQLVWDGVGFTME